MKRAWFGVVFAILSSLSWSDVARGEEFFTVGAPQLNPTATSVTIPHFAELARELSRAVVNISVEADPSKDEADAAPAGNPFARRDRDPSLFSVGSGFIVNSEGFIVTNNHVIERSRRIVVRLLDDKTEYEATVIGRDPKTDVALLKIVPKSPLPPVFLGDSNVLEVGEWVMAIGNQFQLGQTVTAGIISALARKVPSREAGPYDSYIQTDASINPGSSGGPLFNSRGQVIGVNTAIFSPGRGASGNSGFNIGIGFAIPINLVRGIVMQLKERGKVTRGFLGLIIQPVDKDVAAAMELPSAEGALVADVVPSAPAAAAGVKRRDVVVGYNSQAVRDHDDLPRFVADTTVGSKAQLDVLRDGKRISLTLVVEELKDVAATSTKPAQEKPNKIGVVVELLSASEAKALGVQSKASSLVVRSVEPGSDAQDAGIVKGDLIEEFGNVTVRSTGEFAEAVSALVPGKPVLVLVRRAEGTRFSTLTLSESIN